MNKYKEIKRKEIKFDMADWERVRAQASKSGMNTTDYIRRMAVIGGKIVNINLEAVAAQLNCARIIGSNINQIAKKANEINSIYETDIIELKRNVEELCHTLSVSASELRSTEV
ncbi:MAG: plasmid mobilization relaxosome protein MobC [Ruminiclostridium sp.]|nr:plasmid mobilization relaxosome protein MobC [Ruminiclostridium sp.]